MKNERLDGTQETAIVLVAESISEPTAELIEKSFADNTLRNRLQALSSNNPCVEPT